jgi:hypothetical protein
MIILIVVALAFLAVRLVITCIATVVAIRMSLDGGGDVAAHRQGPQDAPPVGPWDPVRGPQDAPRPQDALVDPRVARLQDAPVLAEPAPKPRMSPTVRWTSLLVVVRDAGSGRPVPAHRDEQVAAGPTTVLDLVPRPTTGPAYLGGRDDAAYLRGWDDGVDWILEGNPERAPSWSSAAYMTGWNDSIRAMTKARRGGRPVAA